MRGVNYYNLVVSLIGGAILLVDIILYFTLNKALLFIISSAAFVAYYLLLNSQHLRVVLPLVISWNFIQSFSIQVGFFAFKFLLGPSITLLLSANPDVEVGLHANLFNGKALLNMEGNDAYWSFGFNLIHLGFFIAYLRQYLHLRDRR